MAYVCYPFPRVEAILLMEPITSTLGYKQIIPSGLKKSNTREVVSFAIASYKIRTHTISLVTASSFQPRRRLFVKVSEKNNNLQALRAILLKIQLKKALFTERLKYIIRTFLICKKHKLV